MKTRHQKIVFTGPIDAGKSTAIHTISDIAVVAAEAFASGKTKSIKLTNTVAIDYGLHKLNDGRQVHRYGTPGQERFDFMWDILAQGGNGLVLMINNSAPEPISDMRLYIQHFSAFIEKTALVMGITQTDISPHTTIDKYHACLADIDAEPLLQKLPSYLPLTPATTTMSKCC